MFFYAIHNPRMWVTHSNSIRHFVSDNIITYVGYHTYAKYIIYSTYTYSVHLILHLITRLHVDMWIVYQGIMSITIYYYQRMLVSPLHVNMLIYGYEVDSLILDSTWSVYYEAQNKE